MSAFFCSFLHYVSAFLYFFICFQLEMMPKSVPDHYKFDLK